MTKPADAGTTLKCPAQQRRSHGKARTHRGHQDQTPLLQLALFDGRVHCQRDRPGRGITVAIDVDNHTFRAQPEAVRRGVDDAKIGLMRDEGFKLPPPGM